MRERAKEREIERERETKEREIERENVEWILIRKEKEVRTYRN